MSAAKSMGVGAADTDKDRARLMKQARKDVENCIVRIFSDVCVGWKC